MKRFWPWLRFRLIRRCVDVREFCFPGAFRKRDAWSRRYGYQGDSPEQIARIRHRRMRRREQLKKKIGSAEQ